MSIRVHDLAKRCGLSSKEMIEKLKTMKYPVKSASSTIDNITAESIEKEYGYAPPAPELPKPVEVAPPTPPPAPVAPPPPVVVPAPAPVVVKAPAPVAPPKPAPVTPRAVI